MTTIEANVSQRKKLIKKEKRERAIASAAFKKYSVRVHTIHLEKKYLKEKMPRTKWVQSKNITA